MSGGWRILSLAWKGGSGPLSTVLCLHLLQDLHLSLYFLFLPAGNPSEVRLEENRACDEGQVAAWGLAYSVCSEYLLLFLLCSHRDTLDQRPRKVGTRRAFLSPLRFQKTGSRLAWRPSSQQSSSSLLTTAACKQPLGCGL